MNDRDRARGRAGRGGRLARIRHAILPMVGAALLAGAVQAQSFRFTEFEIQGNTRIEAATILSNLGVARGEAISAGALNDGIQRLQASGLFQRVELIPQGSKLIVLVEEYPIVNRIAIEGNVRLSDEDLLTVVTSTPRRTYDPARAERDAAAIAEAYSVSGRLATTVTPKIIERSNNRVDLVFEVAEGRVSEVERISFTGNRAFSDRRLRRVLGTSQAGIFRAIIGSDTFVQDRVRVDEQLLRDFYLSRGYADFQLLSATPELSPSRDAFFLTFQVQEGQLFRFGRVTATTDLPEIDLSAYLAEIQVDPGDIFTPQALDRTVQRLELLALRQGLTFVRVTPVFNRNPRDLTIDTTFRIERGERIFVERIDIEGNQTTLDRVIRRQFDTVEGDPFNPRAIRAAAERIRALGYFSQADVEAREGTRPDQVIIDVDVEEQPTGTLGFGVNYSVEGGAGISLSFAEANFLGRGQTFNIGVDTGSENTSANLTFVEPYFLDRDLAASISIFYSENSDDDLSFDTKTVGIRPALEFPTGEFSRVEVFYELSEDTLEPNDLTQLSQILEGDAGSNITSALGYRWNFSTIGRGLDPSRGIRLRFGQEFAGLGGDTEFVKTSVLAGAQRAILNEEVTLSATVEGGVLVSLGDTNSLQANRFFNRQSIIRGFESAGIGPRDLNAQDDALGGNRFVAARFEAQFPIGILPEEYGISGAAFVDMASVWGLDDTDGGPAGGQPVDDDFFLNSAVGFGILWDTQIGPLRFNFTRAINKRSYDLEQNFDLTIETRF